MKFFKGQYSEVENLIKQLTKLEKQAELNEKTYTALEIKNSPPKEVYRKLFYETIKNSPSFVANHLHLCQIELLKPIYSKDEKPIQAFLTKTDFIIKVSGLIIDIDDQYIELLGYQDNNKTITCTINAKYDEKYKTKIATLKKDQSVKFDIKLAENICAVSEGNVALFNSRLGYLNSQFMIRVATIDGKTRYDITGDLNSDLY